MLATYSLVSAYEVVISEIESEGRAHFQVELTLLRPIWEKRRRYDGFVLLATHPDLPQSSADIVRLYRAKDAIEKDFETYRDQVVHNGENVGGDV